MKKEEKLIAYLKQEEELIINEYVHKFYKSTKESEPITDGIVDIEKYLKSKYRICWVLKEPYDEGDGTGGGWSLTDRLAAEDFSPGKGQTWRPMIYVTHSLLNNFIPWNKMKEKDAAEIADALKHIALINIGKMPGFPKSNDKDLIEKYKSCKPLLHWQLKVYDPQIIIFGYTFDYFKEDLNIEDNEIKKPNDNIHYVVKNNKIYLHAYHPAQMEIPREDYVQSIINVVKANIDSINKT